MIKFGQAKNARKIGVSRVRVCQYIRLLSLDASVIKALEQLSDPLTERVITERLLGLYLRKTPKHRCPNYAFCHTRASGNPDVKNLWIPAFAGMTDF